MRHVQRRRDAVFGITESLREPEIKVTREKVGVFKGELIGRGRDRQGSSGFQSGFQCLPDGAWSIGFPDRGIPLDFGGQEYILIANAAENGGGVLFDVEKRKIVQWFRAEAETPIYLPIAKKVVTVISGKMKQRTPDGLEKDTAPGKKLLVIDIAPLETGGKATFQRIPFAETVVKVEAIDPETSTVLLLVTGNNELVTYDLTTRKEIAREPAKGQ